MASAAGMVDAPMIGVALMGLAARRCLCRCWHLGFRKIASEKDAPMRVIVKIATVAFATSLQAQDIDPATILLGQQLYASNCAACHGANQQGQPDWKHRLATGRMPAPPHDVTGHTWHHSDRDLFNLTELGVAAVVGGGYESDMPAFGGKLSDDEIKAVLDYIKSTWPKRAQASQAAITAADVAQYPPQAGQ